MQLPATIVIDDAVLEHYLRRLVDSALAERAASPRSNVAPDPSYYLVSSIHPADINTVVEAPDTSAGERNEPHWRVVQGIRVGDVILFRDSRQKAIVGLAVADRRELGSHRHAPEMRALRWWLRDAQRFTAPLPDSEFARIFKAHDDAAAGFRLFRSNGQFSQKTYAYPLNRQIASAVLRQVGVEVK